MLQSILLATDFRPASDDALNAATQLATTIGSQVSVLTVMENAPSQLHHLYRRRIGERLMQPLLQSLAKQQVTVAESMITFGPLANTIVSVAQERDVDLIVIGAGKWTRQDGFSIGPIAEAVITHAPQPVLAVRPGDPQTHFKRILCPVDQSSTSARGLRNAVRLAKVFGGEIIVLSVVPDVNWLIAAVETGEVVDAKGEYATEWLQEFERFLTSVDLSDVPWKREIRYGMPHEEIVAAANEHCVDLIVMGATGRTGLVQVLLGSTTRRLLQNLPCSLLTVKQEDVLEELFESDMRVIALLAAEARTLSDAGMFVPAIAKYRQVLSRDPFHVAALEGLVSAHEKTFEFAKADKYRRCVARLRQGAEPRVDS